MSSPSHDNGAAQGVEEVHRRVRTAILRGEIPARTPVSQVQLAEELGVSRTPLREALRMIQREGLLEGSPRHRLRVAPLSGADLEQLYSMRIWLEALAVQISVPLQSEDDLAELDGLLADMTEHQAARDFDQWDKPHAAFHRGLVQHAGDRIVSLVVEFGEHGERYRRVYLAQPLVWSPAADEHVAILQACRDRDGVLAGILLARHLARTALTVCALIDPSQEPSLLRSVLASLTESPLRLDPRTSA